VTIDYLRAAVRPLVTYSLVLGQILLAAIWATTDSGTESAATFAPDAFAALSPFTMATVVYYFVDRGHDKRAERELLVNGQPPAN